MANKNKLVQNDTASMGATHTEAPKDVYIQPIMRKSLLYGIMLLMLATGTANTIVLKL